MTRSEFLAACGRGAAFLALGGTFGALAVRNLGAEHVWQIDPARCTQCGKCATACVRQQSAVRCFHSYPMCGYCDLCSGFMGPQPLERNEGAENQICPVGALRRRYLEDPYYEYTIDEELCIGCGRCVEGCVLYGNGSLYLQVRQDLCQRCNQCAIAKACPPKAFVRLPADNPYFNRGGESGA